MKANLLTIFLFSSIVLSAQRANYWYFGSNAGLNFNNNPPSILTNGQTNIADNTSTISDNTGQLLFYTNGVTVWNKNHVIMPNGTGLIGHLTAGQCALIVPIPCNPSKYAIFHTTEFASPGQLHYTVVDMSLSAGLGDVVPAQKNISLGTGWTEKLCAYYNAAGNSYWVLTHRWGSNQFTAFEVNSTSIATISVGSAVGSIHNCGTYSAAHDAMGQLTFSPDGAKVLNALTCQDKFELFDFNMATGMLSNPITVSGPGGNAWGTAFSPDSKKMYVNSIFSGSIYQYDLSTYNQAAIVASQSTVGFEAGGGYHFGYMELGPNGKIYIAKPNTTFLSVVNNPNGLGAACNFSLFGQSLGNSSTWGISRIAYNIPAGNNNNPLVISSSGGINICAGQTTTLTAGGANTYSWNVPGANGNTVAVAPAATSTYVVSGNGPCGSGTGTIVINVVPGAALQTSGITNICKGASTTLFASGATSYTWISPAGTSNGASIIVSPTTSTTYTVYGSNPQNSCPSQSFIAVSILPSPTISTIGNTVMCLNDGTYISASGATTYTWSNGAPGFIAYFNPPFTSTFAVMGTNGTTQCTGKTTVTISVVECTDISEHGAQNNIKVYPIPVSEWLSVDFLKSTPEVLKYIVFNPIGENILQGENLEKQSGSKFIVDLRTLAPGLYFLSFEFDGLTRVFRVVKE